MANATNGEGDNTPARAEPEALERLRSVPVQLTVELGRKRVRIGELLRLGPGSVIELTTLAGDALDVRVNDRLVARGEAVAVGDVYGIRILEIVSDGDAQQAGGAA